MMINVLRNLKKIIQLPTKEFIAEYLAKLDAETKKRKRWWFY
jgi:hypothetical protein